MQWSRRVEDKLEGLAPLAESLIMSASSLTLSLTLSGVPISKIASGIFQLSSAPFELDAQLSGSIFAVSQKSDNVTITSFVRSATAWVDDDLPLHAQFLVTPSEFVADAVTRERFYVVQTLREHAVCTSGGNACHPRFRKLSGPLPGGQCLEDLLPDGSNFVRWVLPCAASASLC